MPKLCQIIAVSNGKKAQTQSGISNIVNRLQKSPLLQGITRTYRPKDEDGEVFPPESKSVQETVESNIDSACTIWQDLFDIVLTQDYANKSAGGDIKINNVVLATDVPVTTLLFLEKELKGIAKFIESLPTLDTAQEWQYSNQLGYYKSAEVETVKTKKIPKAFVKAEATKEHPAQVDVFTEDIVTGYWSKTDYSGAIPLNEKRSFLENIRKVQEAVVFAREEANSIEIENKNMGRILSFIFDKTPQT